MRITLKWNRNLTTYDGRAGHYQEKFHAAYFTGVPLNLEGLTDARLKTPSIKLRLVKITSKHAMKLTENNWDADTGLESDILPECVPDGMPHAARIVSRRDSAGVIQLSFSVPVNLAVLQQNLKVGHSAFRELQLFQSSCRFCR